MTVAATTSTDAPPRRRTRAVPDLPEVDLARAVARTAHYGQTDKQHRDYFTCHVEPVAATIARAGARGSTLHAAAYLHDVLEDVPDYTPATLRAAGLSEETIRLVVVLTRRPDETYAAYIHRVSRDRKARLIKLADNNVNTDGLPGLYVMAPLDAVGLERRYRMARNVLTEAIEGDL